MFILSTSTVNCYTILFNRWSVQNGSVAKKCMHMHLVHQCLVNEDNTTGMYWSTIHVVLGSCCFFGIHSNLSLLRMDAGYLLAQLDLNLGQTEDVLRLLRVDTGHLHSPGTCDQYLNHQIAG